MSEKKGRPIFGVVAVLLGLSALGAISYGNLGENLVYYWSPTEIVAKAAQAQGATVRLGGLVVPGTFDAEACAPGCDFRITDGSTEVRVRTEGLPPQMFREGIGVVVEGQLQGDVFHTDRVMIKHSNEYRAPEDGAMPADMYKTLEDPT